MSQALTRKNFTDILLDPTTIAVVGSIAIHAIFAANLAFFTQPSKELKKPDPGTVKVVELTPSELQRIPQAPKPVAIPTPSQQVLPPVYQPSTPAPAVTQPINPPIVATEPNTIPLTPIPITPPLKKKVAAKSPVIRIPPKQKVTTKTPDIKKDQKAIPQEQPEPPTFDSDSFKPTPEPTPTPDKPKVATKPSPQTPTPPKKKTTSTRKKSPKTQREMDGEEQDDRSPSKKPDSDETGLIIPVPKAGTKTAATPTATPSPTEKPPGDGNGSRFYGDYTVQAAAELAKWQKKYPNLKIYPSKLLKQKYPEGTICPKLKQPPFIAYGAVFGQVPENKDNDIIGGIGADSIEGYAFGEEDTPEKRIWIKQAKGRAIDEVNEAEKNRPSADKGRQVVYTYRVELDPTTCIKK